MTLMEKLTSGEIMELAPVGSTVSIKGETDMFNVNRIEILADNKVFYVVSLTPTSPSYKIQASLVKLNTSKTNLYSVQDNIVAPTNKDDNVLSKIKEANKSLQRMSYRHYNRKGNDTNELDYQSYVDIVQTKSFGYVKDKIVLANDVYLKINHQAKTDGLMPTKVEVFTREVKLKPLYKRLFTLLLYGRSHPNNFSMVESDHDYANRLDSIILNEMSLSNGVYFKQEQLVL